MVPFSVGITGHRIGTLDLGVIHERLREVLTIIAEAFRSQANQQMRIVSPLADGVDIIAARIAVDMGWDLLVPLPFPADVYAQEKVKEKEFDDKIGDEFRSLLQHERATVITMDYPCRIPRGDWNKTAFEAAGRMMFGQSDLLIAVWDGLRERGPGGTGQIVREADDAQIPIIWVNATEPSKVGILKPGSATAPVHTAQINFPVDAAETSNFAFKVAAIINSIVDQPKVSADADPDICGEYIGECDKPSTEFGHRHFKSLFPKFYRLLARPPKSSEPPASEVTGPIKSLWDQVGEEYKKADTLAIHYANLYRSSFLTNYFLGALAVTLAMAGGVLVSNEWLKIIFGALELLVLSALVINWHLSIKRHWHEKFTDYRLLAEHARHLQCLLPFGIVPFTRAAAHDPEHPRQHWVSWYLRNIARRAKPISIQYAESAYKTQMLKLLADDWVGGQLRYQKIVNERSEKAESRLLKIAFALLYITIGACVIHIGFELAHWFDLHVLECISSDFPHILVTLAAALPAWATASHSVAQRAEFVRLHKRSGAMVAALKSIKERFDLLKAKQDRGELATYELAALARETAVVMLQEAFDWRIQYRMGDFNP